MPTADPPETFQEAFANSRSPSDAVELAQVHRVLRARILERQSEPLHFDRYEIRRCLGAGGYGTVYEAFDSKLNRRVALKILRPRWNEGGLGGAHDETRLLREARAIACISDPRVVAVYDVAQCPAELLEKAGRERPRAPPVFMVTEYVEGRLLGEWLREKPPPSLILRVFREAARGLMAAHRGGLVHGDFKPENVIVTPSDRVKIIDFGIARAVGASLGSGRFTGTPGYASPEQRSGKPLSEKSDQYSFSVTLYEAVHGRRPGDAAAATHAPGAPKGSPTDTEGRRLAQWVDPILRRGLAVSPDDRFESMQHVASLLEKLYAGTRPRTRLIPVALAALAMLAPTTEERRAPNTRRADCVRAAKVTSWNPARAQALELAFAVTELPYANDSWQSAMTELQAYEGRIRDVAAAVCNLAGESDADEAQGPIPSRPLFGPALACLEERQRALGSLLDVMAERPKEVLPQVVDAVFSLPQPASCLSAQGGSAARARVMPVCAARVESELYALDAGLTAAIYHEGVSRSGEARAAALACAPERLGPWAELVHGLYLLQSSHPAEAAPVLRAAFLAAEVAGDARTAMRAITAEIGANDERGGQTALVNRLIEDAMARSNAGPDMDSDLQASLLEQVSRVRRHQGHYSEAFDLAERALGLREKHWGARHPLTNRAKKHLADVYYRQRDFRRAETIGREVLDTILSYVGPNHPDVASLHTLLGNIDWRRGHYEPALDHFGSAQRIWSQLFGSEDQRATNALASQADVHVASGQFSTAWSVVEPVLERLQASGDETTVTAGAAETAAAALTGMGRYREASRLLDLATNIRTKSAGADHPNQGYPLLARGRLELARGDWKRAHELCSRLVDLWRRLLGDQYPKLSWAYTCVGLADLSGGRKKSAAAMLELARSLFDSDVDDPRNLAEIEFALAQSLANEDPTRARALAAKSAEFYLHSPAHKKQAAPVLAWQQRMSTHSARETQH